MQIFTSNDGEEGVRHALVLPTGVGDPTQQFCNLALETDQLGTSAEAPNQSADVGATIVNLTWDCISDWIAPNPRESSKQSIMRMAMTYRPRKFP